MKITHRERTFPHSQMCHPAVTRPHNPVTQGRREPLDLHNMSPRHVALREASCSGADARLGRFQRFQQLSHMEWLVQHMGDELIARRL